MGYTKNIWVDRNVEFPNRYNLTNVSGDTYDIISNAGTIIEEGTPITAAKMNNLETGVEYALKKARWGGIQA